ncbi:1,2-epoxyphenylacetyl-CoA isomerase [bioreactor metagenome]|uniref:1,2-epoxyphenylacetyl-CoA isomerase n=1 Tax=bioreactor metagenome TaxID=1076179 RepID=A0A645H1E8_9ZZZZ
MRLANLRVPTIAAVNGVAAGAGASLALACDMVIAAQSAFFMLPFAKIGLIPDTACSWLVPQRLGQARALGLAITGNKLPAAKAAEWGLIWEAVADDAFAASTAALAQQLSGMPTRALVRTRQAMQAGRSNTLEQQLTLEGLFMRELGRSGDYVEGVAAFLDKRPARFTGA